MILIPTFERFVADAGGSDDLAAQWARYDQAVWLKIREMEQDPALAGRLGLVRDVLAEDVISSHLGPEWLGQDVAASCLGNTDVNVVALLLARHRKYELARRLYEFQSFDWFPHFVRHLSTNDLLGATFEADVLQALMYAPGEVARTVEIGRKGEDFDVSVTLPTGVQVPVEVKAKRDDTAFTGKTVINTVKGAARQLPKGTTGWLFLRIPFSWLGRALEDTLAECLGEGLRQTSRVGAVFVAVDKLSLSGDHRSGGVRRHWYLHLTDSGEDILGERALLLHRLLEAGLDNLAPRAPF